MKKDKEKRKHHESTIGKIIYGFLLFLPLLAIGITCGYAMFNKNAYQSYYGETINDKEKENINDITTYVGFTVFDVDTSVPYSLTDGANIFDVEHFSSSITGLNNEDVSIIHMYSAVYQNDNNMWLSLRDSGNNTLKNINLVNNSVYFTCYINDYERSNNNTIMGNFEDYFYTFKYNKESFVSEVFYYSVDTVEQSNLFNWAKTSMIYTGMLNFTTALNVTNTFMPMLLTYWLIISVIYFLYDIILIILVVLHRKIHELQESI